MNPIRRYRKELGMTQEELAYELSMTQATISRFETGDRKPDIDDLIAIAKFFGCKVDDLIDK